MSCDQRFCALVRAAEVLQQVVSPRSRLISSTVQQTPICTHRTDEPLLQRRPVGVGGHPSDLWQIPREERRSEGTVWERPPEFFLPHKVLGEFLSSFTVTGRSWRKPSALKSLRSDARQQQPVQVQLQCLGVIRLHREDCSLNVGRMYLAVFGLA